MSINLSTYRTQDLEKLWKIFMSQLTELEYNAIVKECNFNWLQEMKVLLPKQNTLYVVGAGHLPGENGIINLLREAGYKVKPL